MSEMQKILVNRLNKVLPATKDNSESLDLTIVSSALVELHRLGYIFKSSELVSPEILSYTENDWIELLDAVKSLRGDADYKPMYPNFPKQVMQADEAELYWNALVHYVGATFNVNVLPSYLEEVRDKLDENIELTILEIATVSDIEALTREIAVQGIPFSTQDIEDLSILAKTVHVSVLPVITVKENVAILVTLFSHVDFSDSFVTVTDVLRLAVAFSDGDVSLADNTKFHLSRAQRREVLRLLDNVLTKNSKNVEDFGRYTEAWKRLAYHLHYHEYATRKVKQALNTVQSEKIISFDSYVESAIKYGDVTQVLSILSSRPGVFARRLAEILRKFNNDRDTIVKAFNKVAPKVSVRVLVQLWNHFNGPTSDVVEKIVVRYKSRNQRSGVKDNTLVGDQSDVIAAVENGLRNRFDKKVFVKNDNDDSYVVPLSVRSASPGLRVVGVGSRLKVADDKNTVRLFMHWRNIDNDRVDLDLSAFFMNETFTKKSHVSYTNLRSNSSYHSGDITSAPNGAAEFIDVNIDAALNDGWRYILMSVFSYSGQAFAKVPEAWAGVMLRSKPHSGEIFEPSTISQRFDLKSESRASIPLVFDMKTRELIWWDSSININSGDLHNIESATDDLRIALKSLTHAKFMTVDKLVELSAVTVDDEASADVVIDPSSISDVLQLLS